MEPKTPKELYWAKMAGEDVTLPEPKTPEEAYLSKMAGEDVILPDPKTPKEYYMKSVAENGGFGDGWQEVNLVTANNLEWTLFPETENEYHAVIEQEIDVKPRDFIICTIGDEVVKYQSVCRGGVSDLQLVDDSPDQLYTVYYSPQGHVVEIFTELDTAPTANTFILSKLTNSNSSSTALPDEPVINPGEPGR